MDLIVVYAIRILLLLAAIPLLYMSRYSIRGTARMLIILDFALIMRSIDDIGHLYGIHVLDETATAILSSVVAVVFFLDVWRIFRERKIHEAWVITRQDRERKLEMMRAANERGMSWDKQGYNIDT